MHKGSVMNSSHERFDELLIEAIDEGLCVLGEPMKNHLYIIFENNFGIRKHEIPKEIEYFSYTLHRLFGWGACRLEIKFMEKLYPKINSKMKCPKHNLCKWVEDDISFVAYVETMRNRFVNSV